MGRKKSPTTIRAEAMLADGVAPAVVAKKLKLTLSRVYNIRSRANLSAKPKPKPRPMPVLPVFDPAPPVPVRQPPRTLWERIAALF